MHQESMRYSSYSLAFTVSYKIHINGPPGLSGGKEAEDRNLWNSSSSRMLYLQAKHTINCSCIHCNRPWSQVCHFSQPLSLSLLRCSALPCPAQPSPADPSPAQPRVGELLVLICCLINLFTKNFQDFHNNFRRISRVWSHNQNPS